MRPIAIVDEHPTWSLPLIQELAKRGLPVERLDHSSHAFDPRDRSPRYSAVVNRTSPSSHTRGHRAAIFYAEALLNHYGSLGVPVINPVEAYRFEKSKALQLDLFERLGLAYPRTVVVNQPEQVRDALRHLGFPLVVKPNVGGSGAGIRRFDHRAELEAALPTLDFGPDHTALVQEYVESQDGTIVRVEILGGEYLYAIRIVRARGAGFNLCPADICQASPPPVAPVDLAGCPAGLQTPTGLTVTACDPPREAIEAVRRLTRAAAIDVGGVEYLVALGDGQIRYYDVNATSNFVANAPDVIGFDPLPRFADFVVRTATRADREVRTAA
jgi:hypothetical protein